MWSEYDGGKTIGSEGTEKGKIIKDKEHIHGARITLEEGCGNIPFAITCGNYGLMVHTSFANDITEALQKFKNMQKEINDILFDDHHKENSLTGWIEQFINKYG